MGSVHFLEYYCKCGKFLFNNGDIVQSTTSSHGWNYIFVDRESDLSKNRMNIDLIPQNFAKYGSCNRSLGTSVFGNHREKDKIRFDIHLITRCKVNIDIYRVVDEFNAMVANHFEINMVKEKPKVFPLKDQCHKMNRSSQK